MDPSDSDHGSEQSSLLTTHNRSAFSIDAINGGNGSLDDREDGVMRKQAKRTICIIAGLIGALLMTTMIAMVLLVVHATAKDGSAISNNSSMIGRLAEPLSSSSSLPSSSMDAPFFTTPVVSGSLNYPMTDVTNGTLTPLAATTVAHLRNWWRHQISVDDDAVTELVSSMAQLVAATTDDTKRWQANKCAIYHENIHGFYYDPWRAMYWTDEQHPFMIPNLQLGTVNHHNMADLCLTFTVILLEYR